jgi:hypothetical protein
MIDIRQIEALAAAIRHYQDWQRRQVECRQQRREARRRKREKREELEAA